MKIQDAPTLKVYKRERLRMLVAQGSITQTEANTLWRKYLKLFRK